MRPGWPALLCEQPRDLDPAVRRLKELVKLETDLSGQSRIRAVHGDAPIGESLSQHLAEPRVQIAQSGSLTDADAIRRIRGDESCRAARLDRRDRPRVEIDVFGNTGPIRIRPRRGDRARVTI